MNKNEALDILRDLHEKSLFSVRTALEVFFPEFKESEDERVRKRILLSLQKDIMATKNSGCNTEDLEKCVAWLEKQGEHTNFCNNIQIGDKVTRNEDGVLVNLSQLNRVAKKDEKQDEQSKRSYYIHEVETGNGNIKALVTEKVQLPEFKVGDWIVNKESKEVFHIIKNFANNYETVDVEGNRYYLPHHTMEDYSLWTIQDAKDGDVLAEESCIFIIQKLADNNIAAKTYCALYSEVVFEDGSILYFDIDSTKPATKEQRDKLFKVISNKGYTFDFEKKELSKLPSTEKSEQGGKWRWDEDDEKFFKENILVGLGNVDDISEELYSKIIDWLNLIKKRLS